MSTARRRKWPWILLGVLVVVLVPIAFIVVPILTHQDQGASHQDASGEDWPREVTAHGDDGRTRHLEILPAASGGPVDTSALVPGERFVVKGTGYDPDRGIYVAICKIPDDPGTKPGPCLGGVPSQEPQDAGVEEGAIQYAPSNWINDDWAWKLFGARGFDDRDAGEFTAYIEVPAASDENVDCREVACALYTRNDHTAASDRVQDVHIPVGFAPE